MLSIVARNGTHFLPKPLANVQELKSYSTYGGEFGYSRCIVRVLKDVEHILEECHDNFFFFPKKTPSITYKILRMRLLCTNPCRDAIVLSYVDAH